MSLVLVIGIVSSVLTGCYKKQTEETTTRWDLPAGLKDCKVYKLAGEHEDDVVVVRCPNSETATQASNSHWDPVQERMVEEKTDNVVIDK
jgi:hypothetical protein